MKRFWALLRVNFRMLLRSFSFGGRNKKKVATGAGTLVLLLGLSIYISGVYSALLAHILQPVGGVSLLPMLMAALGCILGFAFTVYGAGGLIFGGRDSDLLLALPVTAFEILLSKVLALYLENLVVLLGVLVPMSVVYLVYGGPGGVFCLLLGLPGTVFLALLPTLATFLVGYLIAWVSARLQKRSAITTLLYLAITLGVILLSLRLKDLLNALAAGGAQVNAAMHGPLLPFGLYGTACGGSPAALLGLALLCAVPFLAVVWLFSRSYQRTLSRLHSHAARQDYKLHSLAASGAVGALLKKEAGRYFGSPMYLLNTSIGLIFLLGGSAFALIRRDWLMGYLGLLPSGSVYEITVASLCMMLGMSCTSSVSISLEGRALWVLKTAPVPVRTLLYCKAAFNLVLTLPVCLASSVLLSLALGFSLGEFALLLAAGAGVSCWIAAFGLLVNLRFPKLDAENDTMVVKQSLSSMIGIFGGMALTGAGVLLWLWLWLGRWVAFPVFLAVAVAVLFAAAAAALRALAHGGVKAFCEL